MVITFIVRVILIFWILSIIGRWIGKYTLFGKNTDKVTDNGKKANSPLDINYTGKIDDAEFEEIDSE